MAAEHLRWPFFDPGHAEFRARLVAWAEAAVPELVDHHDVDASCRRLVRALGEAGWLSAAAPADGAAFDVRAICLAREALAEVSGLADFAFAMQGLGTGAITLFGTREQRARWLDPVRAGSAIAAFALSEENAGSDVAAMCTRAVRTTRGWRIDGAKTWISNGGIADQYVVFAKSGEGGGSRDVSAFIVPADAPGLRIAERIDVIAPHPLATLEFEGCEVGEDALIGREGEGFKVAMATLDVFRPSVGAAALGFARRALREALGRARERRMFGGTLGDLQITQAKLAEMALDVDAAALLVYRAAWAKDRPDLSGQTRITREAAMAKLYATEAAQAVIDKAVQLFGGLGVKSGSPVEELYREIRALRIYEGATEVQKIVIARQLFAAEAAA